MDQFPNTPHLNGESPVRKSFAKKIHRVFQKPLLQALVVFVGIVTTAVTGYGIATGQGLFFLDTRAQNIAKILALRGGETGLVTCDGSMGGSWVDPLTRRQIKITCSPNATSPTPATTVKPSPVITARPSIVPGPTTPAGGTSGGGTTSNNGNSGATVAASYGIWTPSKWDTCPKELHDSFYVIAPDGKKYPTWHPAVVTNPATGQLCSFGHEHGRDPSTSGLWSMIQEHFYYDANKNGQMDPAEKAVAGIPFAYANEQLDTYWRSKGIDLMRHEDHVGHKIEFQDDFAVRQPGINGGPQRITNIKCQVMTKVHQGTHSPDAFSNNLHEVIYFASCNDGNKVALAEMGMFGPPGQHESVCDIDGKRNTAKVTVGFEKTDSRYPGTFQDGSRQIIDKACIDKVFLVEPNGTRFSNNPYEPWPINPGIVTAEGKTVLGGLNLLFDVDNASRYYDVSAPNKIGYFVDLCYLQPNGKKYRGILCDVTDNYGKVTGVTQDDPRSAFDGTNRGAYMKAANLFNAGGPTYWYTDPFGRNAQTTAFPGSIRQYVAPVTIDYPKVLNGPIDPTVINRQHDTGVMNGKKTVHAPN